MLPIYWYGEKLLRLSKPLEVYMHDEVLTKSIVHTVWLNNFFSDCTIYSLQVLAFNGVNRPAKKANYQTTDKAITYKYLGPNYEDTPILTKL